MYGAIFAYSSTRLVKEMARCLESTNAHEQHIKGIPDVNIRYKMNNCIKDGQNPIDKHFFPNAVKDIYLNWEE